MGTRCATCEEDVEDLREHMKEKHVQDCSVRVCHIEKCDHCLRSFDGMIVLHTSDSGDEESSEEEEEDDTGQEPTNAERPPCAEDANGLEVKNPEVNDQQACTEDANGLYVKSPEVNGPAG
ncbi:hypothetical protein MTO96_008868 [Rhipicephalus appendiculatus]